MAGWAFLFSRKGLKEQSKMDPETLTPAPTEEFDPSLNEAPNGDEGTQEQETPTEQPSYMTRADFEAWQRDYDSQQQQRLAEVERKAQAKADKARDTAIRKAAGLDEYANALKASGIQLTPEQIAATKRSIIDTTFWTESSTEEAQPNNAPNGLDTQPVAASSIVARSTIVNYLQGQGLTPTDIDNISGRFAGLPDTPQNAQAFMAEVTAAQQRRTPAAPSQEQRVVQQFGGTAAPAARAAGAPSDPQKEMERLLKQDPTTYPGGPTAYDKRMDDLDKQVEKHGGYK